MPDRKKSTDEDKKEGLEWYEYPIAIPAYYGTKAVETMLGRPGTERGPVEGFLPYAVAAPWNLAKQGLGALLGQEEPGLTDAPALEGTMQSLPMQMLIQALNRARWANEAGGAGPQFNPPQAGPIQPTPTQTDVPPQSTPQAPTMPAYGAPPMDTPISDIIATFAGVQPQAPAEVQPQAPAELPPTMDFSQFPGGHPQGTGGTITFGPGFEGGPETVTLPRGGPAGGPSQADPMQAIIDHIRSNPIQAISSMELAMGQQGMAPSLRADYRQRMAGMLSQAGVDPGAALLYGYGGSQALPQVASMLSRQAQAQAQRMQASIEELGRERRFNLTLAARMGRPTPASTLRFMYDVGMTQAKEEKKRAVVIIFQNGAVHYSSVNKPGWKIFEILRTKKGSIDYAATAFEAYLKGKELPKDVALIDLTGGGGLSQRSQLSTPNAPIAPGGPQATEDDLTGVVNTINRRRGR